MGTQGDIMRLQYEVIRNSHFRALTPEQWIKNYAPKFRQRVNDILQKTGKLPTAEKMVIELSA
jgi:hypothetical protein